MSGRANPSCLTSCIYILYSSLLPVQMEPIKEGYLMKQGKFQVSVTIIRTLCVCICDDPSTSHVTAFLCEMSVLISPSPWAADDAWYQPKRVLHGG